MMAILFSFLIALYVVGTSFLVLAAVFAFALAVAAATLIMLPSAAKELDKLQQAQHKGVE